MWGLARLMRQTFVSFAAPIIPAILLQSSLLAPSHVCRWVTQNVHIRYHAQASVYERPTVRDVVVIGAGLSGLAACYELEKQGARYTVIEVKPRFGGAIRTIKERGFVVDADAFAIRKPMDETLLRELGLNDHLLECADGSFVFQDGTESLLDAITDKLSGGRLMRMAVSSLGIWRNRFTICLENGMMYDAGAIIVAAPAPYAARMLYNLAPDAAQRLSRFRYDSILRVTLGYRKHDLPARIHSADEKVFPFVLTTNASGRVPDKDHLLLQFGVRADPTLPAEAIVRDVTLHYCLPESPIVSHIDHWAEADPLSCYDDDHADNIRVIRESLPDGISLIGSDYCLEPPQVKGIARLDERLRLGRAAALDALDYLKRKRNR